MDNTTHIVVPVELLRVLVQYVEDDIHNQDGSNDFAREVFSQLDYLFSSNGLDIDEIE